MNILFQGDFITDAFRRMDEINPAFHLGGGYALLIANAWLKSAKEKNYV